MAIQFFLQALLVAFRCITALFCCTPVTGALTAVVAGTKHTIPLDTAVERGLVARREPPISTLTWFQGDYCTVLDLLKERTRAVISNNPWLANGCIVQRNKSPWAMLDQAQPLLEFYETTNAPPPVLDYLVDRVFLQVSPKDSPLSFSSTTSAATSINATYRATLQYTQLAESGSSPLMRVTVVPCRQQPEEYFAVILSVSHAIADVASFYYLHSMLLSSSSPPQALDLTPLVEDEDGWARRALGEDAFDLQDNVPANMIKGLLGLLDRSFRPNAGTELCFLVDNDAMNEEKQKSRHHPISGSDNSTFVSTNDVLSSWFFSTCKCTVGFMCIDYRGRVAQQQQQIQEQAARANTTTTSTTHSSRPVSAANKMGRNHWGLIVYQPEDVQHPWQIRQSLHTMRRTISGRLPSAWQYATHGSLGIATSWVSSGSGVWHLPHAGQALVHLPLYDFATYCPSGFVVMRTYAPTPGCTGVYIAGDPRLVNKLSQNRPPFARMPTDTG